MEQTGKGWKAGQLVGTGLMCLGLLTCMGGGTEQIAASGWIMGAGLVVTVIARIGGWWDHG